MAASLKPNFSPRLWWPSPHSGCHYFGILQLATPIGGFRQTMVYGEYTYNWMGFQNLQYTTHTRLQTDMAMVVGDFRGRNMTP